MLFLTNEFVLPSPSLRLQIAKLCYALLKLSLMAPPEKYSSTHVMYLMSNIAAVVQQQHLVSEVAAFQLVLMPSLCNLPI